MKGKLSKSVKRKPSDKTNKTIEKSNKNHIEKSDEKPKMEKIIEICKKRGIIFPTAEIYGSLAGFWDYGPVGALIKRKIENYWRDFFVRMDGNIVEVDGSVVLPEAVFKASGHLESFVDPITQCKKCNSIHRADNLIEEVAGEFVEGKSAEELDDFIDKKKIKCPSCGGSLGDVRMFNLMLKTEVSPAGGQAAYLRPETAQNIFTSFKRMALSSRGKLPFGVAQIGHSFRNEISPRYFIIRVREFNQFEIEMFIDPERQDDCPMFDSVADTKINILARDAQKGGGQGVQAGHAADMKVKSALERGLIPTKYLAYFMAKEMLFYQNLGIPAEALRHRHMQPEETPHYSKGNFDMEIKFDFGWKETVGNAYRGDYDLSKHSKHSKTDLSVVTEDGRKIVPHVVEPSFGFERTFVGVLLHCFREKGEGGQSGQGSRDWDWFAFPPRISPYVVSVLPLVNKEGIPEKAKEIEEDLKQCYDVYYDDSGSIGKRYARADEIGCLTNLTVDYQTKEDGTVTLRDRNTTKQVRVPIKELKQILWKILEGEKLDKLGKQV